MIISFRHKGLEQLYLHNKLKGVKADHVKKLKQILAVLNAASVIEDIQSVQPFGCHRLSGARKKEYAVCVNKNWQVTFEFSNGDVYLTNYEDYHDKKLKK